MRRTLIILALLAGVNLWLIAQEPETPIGPKWWPSEYGADDQRGAANRLGPKKVLEAKELITQGKVYQLGRVYEQEMPLPGKRHFSLTIPGLPTGKPMGKNGLVHNDEQVSGEIGQIGTQFDGLGHIGVYVGNDDVFYNGNKYPQWKNNLFVSALGGQQLRRLEIDGDKVTHQEAVFNQFGRVHDVIIGPDGLLYVSSGSRTDGGEAGRDDHYYQGGETDLTACLWRLDPKATEPKSHA